MNNRLTLDYGMRFTHQQPQHDQFQQMSNFFPEQWSARSAPLLYVAGLQQRRSRLLRQHPERDGSAHRADPDGAGRGQHAGGDRHADSRHRQPANGIRQAGDGIAKTGYIWPKLVVGPRFGVAYDLTGDQSTDPPRRRRAVLRPAGREHGVLDSGQPADRDVAGPAQRPLQTLGQGLSRSAFRR